jgi:hypothetical protein
VTVARSNRFSTPGFTVPALAFLRSLTRTQDNEETAGHEHHGNNYCEIYDKPVIQSAYCMFFRSADSRLRAAITRLPTPHRDARWIVPRRCSADSLVGYDVNVPKLLCRAHPENAWRQYQSPQGH